MATEHTFVICTPTPGSTGTACGADSAPTTMKGYMLQQPDMTVFDQVDAATASQVFLAAFSAVVTCFFVARCIGSVLEMIRK
jgi:homoserine acetyltransferase